jgi:hypothetical protein
MQRWQPKDGSTTLDNLTPDQHRLFRFIATRNGHNVALFGGREACEDAIRDRAARFPLDDWGMIDREETPDQRWIREKAAQEDGCIVSVGGLANDIEALEKSRESVQQSVSD